MQQPIKTRLMATAYRSILKPIFFHRDPEDVHDTMISFGACLGRFPITQRLTHALFDFANPMLAQTILGIRFKNPIGLSAGFDKNAELTNILPDVGFGFEEVGSITGEPCAGNPRPRLWRHPQEKSLRVYYGLKNDGAEAIAKRLHDLPQPLLVKEGGTFRFPIGISIAKTNCAKTVETEAAIMDYLKAYRAFKSMGDYLTINISCPNAFGGQPFTDAKRLDELLYAINEERDTKPIFLKLSPDLTESELQAIAEVASTHHVNGLITSNLTKQHTHGNGGLSGKAVEEKSNAQIVYVKKHFGNTFIIIGCGGVFTAEDAYKKIRLGASLIQMITGMIFEGPQIIGQINRELVELLKRDGFKNISEAVGVDIH